MGKQKSTAGSTFCPSIFNHKHLCISSRNKAAARTNGYSLISIKELPSNKLPIDGPLPLGEISQQQPSLADKLHLIHQDPQLKGTSQEMLDKLYLPVMAGGYNNAAMYDFESLNRKNEGMQE